MDPQTLIEAASAMVNHDEGEVDTEGEAKSDVALMTVHEQNSRMAHASLMSADICM